MDEQLRRSDEQYFADIRAVLGKHYQSGDTLTLLRQFRKACKCQMCGDKVDILNCFELRNDRTKKTIVCGRQCIVKYAIVVEHMSQQPIIRFPSKYQTEATKINELRPNTVTVIPLSELLDFASDEDEECKMMMDLGLDPDDPDCSELAPHGMSGDDDEDEDDAEGGTADAYMDDTEDDDYE